MVESKTEEINIDEVMEKIRHEVARRRAGVAEGRSFALPADRTNFGVDWQGVDGQLIIAEENVSVGTSVPPMLRFRRPLRWLARSAGHITIYFARVVTSEQNRFNQSILEAVKNTVQGLRSLGRDLGGRDERVAALAGEAASRGEELAERSRRMDLLESGLSELREKIAEHGRRINSLEVGLSEMREKIASPGGKSGGNNG
jgi:hypothetical protein